MSFFTEAKNGLFGVVAGYTVLQFTAEPILFFFILIVTLGVAFK